MKLIFSKNNSIIEEIEPMEDISDETAEAIRLKYDTLEIKEYTLMFKPGVVVSQAHDLENVVFPEFLEGLKVELR